jgi:hypothetical protein
VLLFVPSEKFANVSSTMQPVTGTSGVLVGVGDGISVGVAVGVKVGVLVGGVDEPP